MKKAAGADPKATVKNGSPSTKYYWKLMNSIPFMEKYSQESDIFNFKSTKCHDFLIKTFCFLQPEFHYLEFINTKDVNQEIIKAAGILHLLHKTTNKKNIKSLEDLHENDIHKFWIRLFSSCKRKVDLTDYKYNINLEDKLKFCKSIKTMSDYLNYDFVKYDDSLNNINLEEEIQSWSEKIEKVVVADDSTCLNNKEGNCCDVDVEKFISDASQVHKLAKNFTNFTELKISDFTDFFTDFLHLTKNILLFKTNLSFILSFLADGSTNELLLNNESISDSIYFIERCNTAVKSLKIKAETLH